MTTKKKKGLWYDTYSQIGAHKRRLAILSNKFGIPFRLLCPRIRLRPLCRRSCCGGTVGTAALGRHAFGAGILGLLFFFLSCFFYICDNLVVAFNITCRADVTTAPFGPRRRGNFFLALRRNDDSIFGSRLLALWQRAQRLGEFDLNLVAHLILLDAGGVREIRRDQLAVRRLGGLLVAHVEGVQAAMNVVMLCGGGTGDSKSRADTATAMQWRHVKNAPTRQDEDPQLSGNKNNTNLRFPVIIVHFQACPYRADFRMTVASEHC